MDSDECGCKIKVEPSEIVLYECQFCKHLEFEDYEALESHLEVHTEEERSLCIKQVRNFLNDLCKTHPFC